MKPPPMPKGSLAARQIHALHGGEDMAPRKGDPVMVRHEKYRIVKITGSRTLVKQRFGGAERTVNTRDMKWDDVAGVWRA